MWGRNGPLLSRLWPYLRAPASVRGRVVSTTSMSWFSTAWPAFFLGIMLWGAHMGLTQGLLSAMVADAAPAGVTLAIDAVGDTASWDDAAAAPLRHRGADAG